MSSTLLLPPPANSFVIGPAVINTHRVGNCLLNSLRLYINRRGGSSPLRFVERQDEGRARGCAQVPGQGIGAALRCLFTHPPGATNSTLSKNLHSSQGFEDIHGNLYVWIYIWEYVCVEERVRSPTSFRFVKTTRQAQHTNRSTLEARRYHSSIHLKRLSEYVGFIRRSFSY